MPAADADPFAAIVPLARSPFHPGSQAGAEPSQQAPVVIPPVPTDEPVNFAALSSAENRRRRRQHRANRTETGPADSDFVVKKRRPPRAAPRTGVVMTMAEALERTTQLARKVHDTAISAETRQADVKHATVAYGVLMDKHLALTGRPASRQRDEDADEMRVGVLDLARRALGMP